jgi:drug/metabolite transporter (DMT)-like permease
MVLTPVQLGIVSMLAGMFLFACNDTLGKFMLVGYSVGMLMVVRSVAGGLMLLPALWRERKNGAFADMFKRKVLFRSALSVLESFCFYAALITMPVADIMVLYMAAPIFTTAMAPFLLGEHVGWRRWSAVLVGFIGVVVAINPSGEMIMPGALIALSGSLLFAVSMILTRQLKAENGASLMGSQMLASLVVCGLTLPLPMLFPDVPLLARFTGWTNGPPMDIALLALLGIVATCAFMLVNYSLKVAPASVVVPFQYISIVWATILGYLAFGDLPGQHMVIGCVIIVGSGLYIFFREQHLGSQPQADAASSSRASTFSPPP